MMDVKLRLATSQDIDDAARFIDDAREYQNRQGFVQWTKDYPNREAVVGDVANARGYILTADDVSCGYLCIDFDGEPAYNNINGRWLTEGSNYAVVHRVAFGREAQGKGISHEMFTLIKDVCREHEVESIRVDTDNNNNIMKHVLEREGFIYCGTVIFQGSPKVAYELVLGE